MTRLLIVFVIFCLSVILLSAVTFFAGLPMRVLRPPGESLIGAVDYLASDRARSDIFSGAAERIVPFQILYPAKRPGREALYMPDGNVVIDALAERQGWMVRATLGQLGGLLAPWTEGAEPLGGESFPVIIDLPGVTGYMQMSSFQTTELVAHGFVVVTLNQPGAVAVAVLPHHQILAGMTREMAVALVAPSYRRVDVALPSDFSVKLAPEKSVVPYFSADVSLVLGRLAEINADPANTLHGLFDLDHVGVMGVSLGAIIAAQACASDARIGACLMMDAPVPLAVAETGLRVPALWISRMGVDQRIERAASGGWPDDEIAAQAESIDEAVSHSEHGKLVQLHGLFHIDFTDLPALQAAFGWFGQSGRTGIVEAHRQINELTIDFFSKALGPAKP